MSDKTENRARAEGLKHEHDGHGINGYCKHCGMLRTQEWSYCPVRVDAALAAAEARALERAAEVCDDVADAAEDESHRPTFPQAQAMAAGEAAGACHCADAIRALKEAP